ncbi:hypothetical protein TIFTF001_033467 [Ficus carica]|uniref:Uncharacterized protein n=1 Tax=Ficus carica TaxID=3494 RepID=A0AA88J983_FICCA|nr:hypothetical protein TIFTF001_033467 [Ficus carica]
MVGHYAIRGAIILTSSSKAITSNILLVSNARAKSQLQLNESPIDPSFMAYSSNIDFMSIEDMLTPRDNTSTDLNGQIVSSPFTLTPRIMKILLENKDISAQLLRIKQNGLDIGILVNMTALTSVQSGVIKFECNLKSKHQHHPLAATSTISRSTRDGLNNAINLTQ